MLLGLAALATIAGVSFVVQQAVNAHLSASLGSAVWAGFASYLGGTVCMLLLAYALRAGFPAGPVLARTNWWAWGGGVFGALYIGISILLIPRLGTAAFVGFLVAGQMLCSLILDRYGLLGVPPQPLDWLRIAGAVLLVAGVILIRA